MRTSKPLDALLGKNRQNVLSRTHLQAERWWYIHELARSLKVRPSSIQRDVTALVAAGILLRRKDGNRVYLKADTACPIFPEVRDLLLKTVGLVDVLRKALRPLRTRIETAFVYGSIAASEEHSRSDVDLMVIGSATLAEIASAIRGVEADLGRSVNPTVYTRAEFERKLQTGHHFLKNVAASKKLFIFGSENELADAVGERTHKAARNQR